MTKLEQPPVIVVTGGTGSGKSTVAGVFKKCGARVIDVDRFAHRLLKPESIGWHEILQQFCGAKLVHSHAIGESYQADDFVDQQNQPLPELPWVINSQGCIRRDKLGATVFASQESLETLNKILHPKLKKSLEAKIAVHKKISSKPLILDMAVYPEKAFRSIGDVVLWVRAPGGLRAQRLADNRAMSMDEASSRVRIQWKDELFKKIADFTLPNLGSDTDLKQAAEAIWTQLLKFANKERA